MDRGSTPRTSTTKRNEGRTLRPFCVSRTSVAYDVVRSLVLALKRTQIASPHCVWNTCVCPLNYAPPSQPQGIICSTPQIPAECLRMCLRLLFRSQISFPLLRSRSVLSRTALIRRTPRHNGRLIPANRGRGCDWHACHDRAAPSPLAARNIGVHSYLAAN